MSLILIAVTATVAASLGYLVSRKREAGPGQISTTKVVVVAQKTGGKKADAGEPANALSAFELGLGDVVSAEGEERWLAGAIVAKDTKTIAALYIAPEGIGHRTVVVFPKPERTIQWLAPTELISPAEPPATLEIEGLNMHRKARLPVLLDRLGQGTPHVGSNGILALYEAGGREAAVVLTSEGKVYAWFGRKLDEGEYDRMGGGTLDEA